MILSIRVRPITHEEREYLRKSDLGRQTASLDRMAIMGPAEHPYIANLNIEIKPDKVHLGDGQYYNDWPSLPLATGGKTVPVVWRADCAYDYLLAEARRLEIPVFYTPTYPQCNNPLYFENKYAEAFLDSFSCADRALGAWYRNRPFLARCFGGMEPEQNSKEAGVIREEVRRTLVKSIKISQ